MSRLAANARGEAAGLWMIVEHLVGIGRRSAIERMAHFFIELGQRRQLVGMASETKFECPLNRYLMADALGLNAIHVNRVLRQLREQQLITLKADHVVIEDVKGLMKLAGFDNAYARSRDSISAFL